MTVEAFWWRAGAVDGEDGTSIPPSLPDANTPTYVSDLRSPPPDGEAVRDLPTKGCWRRAGAIGEPMLVLWRPGDLRSFDDDRMRKLDLRRVRRLPLGRLPKGEPGPNPAVVPLLTGRRPFTGRCSDLSVSDSAPVWDCLLYTSPSPRDS